jgi:hypothetical protein
MKIGVLIGELFLAFLSLAYLYYASSQHNSTRSNSGSLIKFPKALARFLGSSRSDGRINIKWFALQIIIITMWPASALFIADLLPREKFIIWGQCILAISLVLIIIDFIRTGGK